MTRVLFAALLACSLAPCATETFVLDTRATGDSKRRLPPCSTFKIPNAAMILETGTAHDESFVLKYDPQRDGRQSNPDWARDLDLRGAIRASAAWYFQEMSRRMGPAKVGPLLRRFQYGNADISAGIDKYWLGTSLKVSAEEQVAFLRRLYEGSLGLSPRTTALVKDITLLEETPEYRWHGKTGTCWETDRDKDAVAWHVGWVERGAEVRFYAFHMTGEPMSKMFAARPARIRALLAGARLIAPEPPPLDARIRAAVNGFQGTVSLFAKNLSTGAEYGLRAGERVRTASTIKLPIMAAAFAAVERGDAKWSERLKMTAEDKVSGSGVIRELADGSELTLRDLVHLMIVVSDNTATNLVLDRISADFVNREMDALGLPQTRALRKVLGDGRNLKPTPSGHSREGKLEEFRRFGLGVSTPREMAVLLEKLHRGQVVSPAASREMLAILQRQQYKDGIGRFLDEEKVASKSGSLDALRSDAGIVETPRGPVVIAITVDGMPRTDYSPENAGSKLIGTLASLIAGAL
ncbi:MAG: serine hydrolase [Bryobacteraceae bacterium]|nr:serine hydrolase [Bryobacteraceae bacterium]